MSASTGGGAPNYSHRSNLQPRLVHLIAGLRHHQVEEAVALLLDYIDGKALRQPTVAASDDARTVARIRHKLADYHFALDTRQHGGDAASAFVGELESILAMPWKPGREAKKRGADAS